MYTVKRYLMTFEQLTIFISISPTIPRNEDWMMWIEWYMVQSSFFPWDNLLSTNSMIFVHINVKNMSFSVNRDSGKNGTWIRCPRNISNLWIQIKHEQWFAETKMIVQCILFVMFHRLRYIPYDILLHFNSFNVWSYSELWSQILTIHSEAHVRNIDGRNGFQQML